jgi:hypothetical protein
MFPASRIFALFAPAHPSHPGKPHPLSQDPDLWRLHLRASTDRASPSPPSLAPSLPGGAVAGLRPALRGPRHVAAPSPGPDRWRLRLRAPTDRASPSPPSPGPSLPGGAYTSRLHVRTALTPVGKVTNLLHTRTAPTPVGKVSTLLHACQHGTDAPGQSHPSNTTWPMAAS